MESELFETRSRQWLFRSIGNIISNIFNYLSCHKEDPLDNRVLLRRLYNSGYLDDQKFHDLCQKCSDNNLDPEELPL